MSFSFAPVVVVPVAKGWYEVWTASRETGRAVMVCTHADDADAGACLLTVLSDPDNLPGIQIEDFPVRVRHALACAFPGARCEVLHTGARRGRSFPVMYGDPESRRACVAVPPGYDPDAAIRFLERRAGNVWSGPYFVAV